jgi:hypothetical protein
MEFIITGLFIIFFSYILLYSLYDILFKRSTIEGLENGDKDDDKEEDKEDKDADAAAKADEGRTKASDADSKTNELNEKHKNLDYNNATNLVQKI